MDITKSNEEKLNKISFEYYMIVLHDVKQGILYWKSTGGFSSPISKDYPLIEKNEVKREYYNAVGSLRDNGYEGELRLIELF